MLKGLKNLFVYKKPSEHGFRFPEDAQESRAGIVTGQDK